MDCNKILLIGARGVGKTQLLERLKTDPDFQEFELFDLDSEIQKTTGQTITEIFSVSGEAQFRRLEQKHLSFLVSNSSKLIVAVGAGCDVSNVPSNVHVIWVKRATDPWGRSFLDRPRLSMADDPVEESKELYRKRHGQYSQRADQVYWMPEGIEQVSLDSSLRPLELQILKNSPPVSKVYLTRTPKNHKTAWNGPLEIRSDDWVGQKIPSNIGTADSVWSIRGNQDFTDFVAQAPPTAWIDWPLEKGLPPAFNRPQLICSLHERQGTESFDQALVRLSSSPGPCFKFSPLVEDWSQLKLGFEWQAKDPQKRSFLPRSNDGRWKWFRQVMIPRQKINFVSDGDQKWPDQPHLIEVLSLPNELSEFAAVLGDPVLHSRSPSFHFDFFRARGMPFFAIQIEKSSWDQAFTLLKHLGLRAAAMTSPLKNELIPNRAVNTWWLDSESKGNTDNTDEPALEKCLLEFKNKKTLVWGGGGTLGPLKKVFPEAAFYSARTGQLRDSNAVSVPLDQIQLFVWAAGPHDPEPSFSVQPELVFDLNYRQESKAIGWSRKNSVKYQNGLIYFQTQAKLQQAIWSKYF